MNREAGMLKDCLVRRLILISFLLIPGTSFAANHYVRAGATGSGTGNDWTNAYTNLPSSLTRGDTYYLADGSYGSHTFNDANSGSSVISIVKATPAAHGVATGWSDAFGAGQAVFSHWNIYTDFYTFDGVRRNADWYRGTLN